MFRPPHLRFSVDHFHVWGRLGFWRHFGTRMSVRRDNYFRTNLCRAPTGASGSSDLPWPPRMPPPWGHKVALLSGVRGAWQILRKGPLSGTGNEDSESDRWRYTCDTGTCRARVGRPTIVPPTGLSTAVCRAGGTSLPQRLRPGHTMCVSGRPRQQEGISSRSWRPDVRGQGVRSVGFF